MQPESWHSFYCPAQGRRLSQPLYVSKALYLVADRKEMRLQQSKPCVESHGNLDQFDRPGLEDYVHPPPEISQHIVELCPALLTTRWQKHTPQTHKYTLVMITPVSGISLNLFWGRGDKWQRGWRPWARYELPNKKIKQNKSTEREGSGEGVPSPVWGLGESEEGVPSQCGVWGNSHQAPHWKIFHANMYFWHYLVSFLGWGKILLPQACQLRSELPATDVWWADVMWKCVPDDRSRDGETSLAAGRVRPRNEQVTMASWAEWPTWQIWDWVDDLLEIDRTSTSDTVN